MTAVDAVSASDAWAVGHVDGPFAENGGIIEHWAGKSWHRVVPPANLLRRFNKTEDDFWAVGATSARNVWVFGLDGKYLRLSGNQRTYGRLPHSKKLTMLVLSAKAFSPTNICAFGCRATNLGTVSARCVPATVRFNGHRWAVLKVPGQGVIWQASAISPATSGPSTDHQ